MSATTQKNKPGVQPSKTTKSHSSRIYNCYNGRQEQIRVACVYQHLSCRRNKGVFSMVKIELGHLHLNGSDQIRSAAACCCWGETRLVGYVRFKYLCPHAGVLLHEKKSENYWAITKHHCAPWYLNFSSTEWCFSFHHSFFESCVTSDATPKRWTLQYHWETMYMLQ